MWCSDAYLWRSVRERQTPAEVEQREVVLCRRAAAATSLGYDCRASMSHSFYWTTQTSETTKAIGHPHAANTDPDTVVIELQALVVASTPGRTVTAGEETVRLDIVGPSSAVAGEAGQSACRGNLAAMVDRRAEEEEEAWDETEEAVASEIHHCKKQCNNRLHRVIIESQWDCVSLLDIKVASVG